MGTSRQSMKTVKGPGMFLAQFVDNKAPFNSLEGMCKWASDLGYNGIQIPTWESFLIDLDKAIDIYPKDPFIFIKNGKEKEINRDLNKAFDDYDKAIKFNIIHILCYLFISEFMVSC